MKTTTKTIRQSKEWKEFAKEEQERFAEFARPFVRESLKGGNVSYVVIDLERSASIYPAVAAYGAEELIRAAWMGRKEYTSEEKKREAYCFSVKSGIGILENIHPSEEKLGKAIVDILAKEPFEHIKNGEKTNHPGTWHNYQEGLSAYLDDIMPVREILMNTGKSESILNGALFSRYSAGHSFFYDGSFFGGIRRYASRVRDEALSELSKIVTRDDQNGGSWDSNQELAGNRAAGYYKLLSDSTRVLADLKRIDPVRYAQKEYAKNEESILYELNEFPKFLAKITRSGLIEGKYLTSMEENLKAAGYNPASSGHGAAGTQENTSRLRSWMKRHICADKNNQSFLK